MNMRRGRPVNLEENQVYYEKVVNRVTREFKVQGLKFKVKTKKSGG
jgi:hypothetical protein